MNGHENGANGATPSADNNASGGGIFSTPDLTIESANIPANVGGAPVIDETAAAPSSDNSSRIASAFANTDATSQLQDVNAAMQSRSNMTTSTATGDIKLAPSTKPKSKAPLIIVILLVLAGVGALVWAVVTGKLSFGGGSSDDIGSTVSLADAQKAYNRYATYLLFGESKDELEGEWRPNQSYKVNEEVYSYVANDEYWTKAFLLLDETIDTYGQIPDMNQSILNKLKSQKVLLTFLQLMQSNDAFSESVFEERFFENGYEKAKEYFATIRTQLNTFSGTALASAVNIIEGSIDAAQDLFGRLLNFGCTIETYDDDSCIDVLPDDEYEIVDSLSDTIYNQETELISVTRSTINEVAVSCWSISAQLTNEYHGGSEDKEME